MEDDELAIEEALRLEQEHAEFIALNLQEDSDFDGPSDVAAENEPVALSFCVSSPEFLANRMAEARAAGDLCDVDILVGGRLFSAHKLVLMLSSPVLRAHITTPVGLSPETSERSMVKLEDIDPELFEGVLSFMYTGQAKLDATNLVPTLFVADRLQVSCLRMNKPNDYCFNSPSVNDSNR